MSKPASSPAFTERLTTKDGSPAITVLMELVSWPANGASRYDWLEGQYIDAIAGQFGVVLGHILLSSPPNMDKLLEHLRTVNRTTFDRFLTTPETSRRIVLESFHPLNETTNYFLSWFEADGSGSGPATRQLRDLGTVGTRTQVLVDADASSHDRTAIDAQLDRVRGVLARVRETAPRTFQIVARSMRELVLRLQTDAAATTFRSNSPQGYVGRTVLTNPNLADDVALAEALIHESMHGLVGMSEALGLVRKTARLAWLSDDQMYDGKSRTTSPWSGVALDLPTYLHACFVWFGLLKFWAAIYARDVFDRDRVRNRIQRAIAGFIDDRAIEQVLPYARSVNPALVACLTEMCSDVRRSALVGRHQS